MIEFEYKGKGKNKIMQYHKNNLKTSCINR